MTCVVYFRMNGLEHKFHISADKRRKCISMNESDTKNVLNYMQTVYINITPF